MDVRRVRVRAPTSERHPLRTSEQTRTATSGSVWRSAPSQSVPATTWSASSRTLQSRAPPAHARLV